jgi:Domain of unknown function (DUF4136)
MNIAFPERRTSFTVVMIIALLAACSGAPKVRVDQDSHAKFADYKTFAWLEPEPADAADAKAEVATLADRRVSTSVTAALQGKGYMFDEAHPDVRVSYEFKVYERPKQSGLRIGLGAGGGSGNVAGGVGVSLPVGKRTETVATMAVNVVDAALNRQVWFGSSEVILSGADATDADVQNLTDTILAKYPVRAK